MEDGCIDAMFTSARISGDEIGPTKRGNCAKVMATVDRHGPLPALTTHAANHRDVTLVQLTFDLYVIDVTSQNLIGDRAFDGDEPDAHMRELSTDVCSPSLSYRVRDTNQDGRRLRRNERRWIVERLSA
jgi:hypothetical protein